MQFRVCPGQMILHDWVVQLPDLEALIDVEGQELPTRLRPANRENFRVLRVNVEEECQLDAFGCIPEPYGEVLAPGQHLSRLFKQECGFPRPKLNAIDLLEVSIEADQAFWQVCLVLLV